MDGLIVNVTAAMMLVPVAERGSREAPGLAPRAEGGGAERDPLRREAIKERAA